MKFYVEKFRKTKTAVMCNRTNEVQDFIQYLHENGCRCDYELSLVNSLFWDWLEEEFCFVLWENGKLYVLLPASIEDWREYGYKVVYYNDFEFFGGKENEIN